MSSIQDPDPKPGDGPNKTNPAGGDGPNKGDDLSTGTTNEQPQDEGSGVKGGGLQGDDAPKTASKGINPVQHSE